MYSFSYWKPVCCCMSNFNCCFLTCIQVSQETGQVIWYSHLFQNFPQFIVIHAVKGLLQSLGVTSKFGLEVQNEAGKRLIEFWQENALIIANTLYQKHKRDSTHGHHQMVDTKIRLIIFFAAKNAALYSQQKQDWELTVAQIMNS